MARNLVADQNKVSLFYESGTLASASGGAFWAGMVQNHSLSESNGIINVRYAGNLSRDVAQFVDGPTEYGGTLEFYPQDWRMLKFAMGSCYDAGSPSPFTHTYTAVNSNVSCAEIAGRVLPTFSIEDFQGFVAGSNFVRTIKGCTTDSLSISTSEGAPITCSVSYKAQSVAYSSGAASSITGGPGSTLVPFMWQHTKVQLPSGTAYAPKNVTLTISNNLAVPNYVDATRNISDLIPQNREYSLALTLNGDAELTKTIYDSYWVGGSEFNCLISSIISTGSRAVYFTCSGCKLTGFNAATGIEGVNEQALTITPKTVTASEDSLSQWANAGSYG